MAYQFKYITASGTFDRFHKGHEAFLSQAFEIAKEVHIGITSDAFVHRTNKSHIELIEQFVKRKAHVLKFLQENGFLKRAQITTLEDIYGPAEDAASSIEAILVTKNSEEGASLVNMKRQKKGLPALTIIKIPLVKTNEGEIVSSTSLRKNLVLPNHIRPLLAKPLGTLLKGKEDNLQIAVESAKKMIDGKKPSFVITVGDVVAKSFNNHQIAIDLAIVDFKIKREEIIKNLSELGFAKNEPDAILENEPGTISSKLSEGIEQAIKHMGSRPFIIKVLGEEDLSVLPAIIHAPLGSLIFYGQPYEGIVMVEVGEDAKKNAVSLIAKFRS